MAGNQHFFGFEIREQLYKDMSANLARIDAGAPVEQVGPVAAGHLVELTQIGMAAYYDRPASLIELPSMVRKAADTGMSTIFKAVEMVIHKLIAKRSLEELQLLSNDVRQLICISDSAQPRYFICFPLPAHLFERAQTLLARVAEDDRVDLYRSDVIHSLEDLIEEGIGAFYTRPIAKIQVGRITKAAADMGVSTVKKGSSMVLHKVFKTMPHTELLPLASYFETLLHQDVKPSVLVSQAG